ncbi:MAG: hypothetical protein ACK49N_09535, partial [Verrucomicrobiota bacterium]
LRAVWNRGQQACFEALESIWESQPFDLLGVDSDNGGEFLNYHLYHWPSGADHATIVKDLKHAPAWIGGIFRRLAELST